MCEPIGVAEAEKEGEQKYEGVKGRTAVSWGVTAVSLNLIFHYGWQVNAKSHRWRGRGLRKERV
jgi:hypothetical protein